MRTGMAADAVERVCEGRRGGIGSGDGLDLDLDEPVLAAARANF